MNVTIDLCAIVCTAVRQKPPWTRVRIFQGVEFDCAASAAGDLRLVLGPASAEVSKILETVADHFDRQCSSASTCSASAESPRAARWSGSTSSTESAVNHKLSHRFRLQHSRCLVSD